MKRWNVLNSQKDKTDIIAVLLSARGLSADQAKAFLAPDYEEGLHNPFLFRDMQAAVDLINKHLQAGNKIVVYGDYDADGVTAAAIMYKTLNFLANKTSSKSELAVYIPDRIGEGYGLKKSAIKHLADEGAKLIITVDNATRNVDEVAYAKTLGLDIIITDHHEAGDVLPDCLIINPKINGEQYPFLGLAGCGVAFKVAQGLLTSPPAPLLKKGEGSHSCSVTPPSPFQGEGWGEVFLKWLLDLVAIGTIADLVPLLDENRVLTKYGLVVLNKTTRIGLKKLMAVAQTNVDRNGNNREVDAWQVGFQIAPRLNAAGRLDHANNAYELLVTEDDAEAVKIAEQLNKTNVERQNITQEIFEQADNDINNNDQILLAVWPGLNCHCEGHSVSEVTKQSREFHDKEIATLRSAPLAMTELPWPSGVMGLVAGKLTEKYYRPALAITNKNGEIVGSGRSIEEFDITAMLEECAEFLSNFGGHKQACGFTLKNREALEPFLDKAKKIAAVKLAGVELTPTLDIDLEINFSDVSEELHQALQKLKPFGVGNPQPKFLTKNLTVVNVWNMGSDGQHLKLKLHPVKSSQGEFNGVKSEDKILFDAVAFSVIDEWKKIKVGDEVDLVYYIDMNEWNGNRSIQLKIIDLKIT